MKKLLRIITSAVLSILLFVTCLSTGASATVVTGYDRGYTGSMSGNGKIYAHGLDLSAWQEGINFEKIKNDGYDFVILRCGRTNGKDTQFDLFYSQAKAVGLDVGVYYYCYATTVSEAATDAKNTLKYIKGKKFEYPIFLDFEDESQNALSDNVKAKICYKFMDKIRAKGYLVGMYSMASRITQDWVESSGLRSKYEGWVAHYYDNTYQSKHDTYSKSFGMYQYTCEKKITGWNYGVDADVAYKNYPLIAKAYGFNGYKANMSLLNTKVTLAKSKATLYLKGKTQIEAKVKDGAKNTTYKSSDKTVATVNSKGVVTAKKQGTAKITVTNNGVKKVFKVKVKNPSLNIVRKTIKVGQTLNLKIKGQAGKATFASSNKNIATVSQNGVVKAIKKGTVTIKVNTNGIVLKSKIKIVK